MKKLFKCFVVLVLIFILSSCDKSYTITFDGNGGTLVSGNEVQVVAANMDFNSLAFPVYVRDGYEFKGWNIDTMVIFADQYVMAVWEEIPPKTITFDAAGGVLNEENTQKVKEGKLITAPIDPIKEGYTFDGWYVDTTKWDFNNDTVSDDLILTAHWIINQYTLTIKYNDDVTPDEVITQDYNTPIKEINITSKVGNTFLEWSEEIPKYMPSEDKTIEAVWEVNQYTIFFKWVYYDANWGNIDVEYGKTFDYNALIDLELEGFEDPVKEGYTFKGWSGEVPERMPLHDIYLDAIWEVNQYTLTIKYNDDVTPDYVITQDYNTKITVKEPTRLGYQFTGWSENMPEAMPAENKKIEAMYSCNVKYKIENNQVIITGANTNNVIVLSSYEGYPTTTIGDKAFISRQGLTTISIPEGLLTIGEKAFYHCQRLTKIEIPSTVTKIGNSAFYDCIGLTDITIPDGIENINDQVFYNCTNLKNITIPNSIKNIGKKSFYNCTSLLNIEFNDGLMSIGDSAFEYCSKIETIIIPNTVSTIGTRVLNGCNSIKELTIPFIGNDLINDKNYRFGYIFGDNVPMSLENVTITSVDELIDCAFDACISIVNITLPDNLKSIGDYAFYNCQLLTNISIPSTVTYFGDYVFGECNSLNYNISNNIKYVGNSSNPYLVLIEADDSTITSITINENTKFIYTNAFSKCNNINSIILPDGLLCIGDYAFSNCSLSNISIPNSIISIGENSFGYISDANIYDNVRYIGNAENPYLVLIGCANPSMESYTINENTKIIRSDAFFWCENLKSIVIPESVISIGNRVFYSCTNLESVVLSKNITTIPDGLFGYCSKLNSVTILGDITSIGDAAFSNCSSLTDIVLPDTVKYIKSYAFQDCINLKNINIPNNIVGIYYSAFSNCNKLENINIPSTMKIFESVAFSNCSSLKSIILPDDIQMIGGGTFKNCTSLTSVTISNTVTFIDGWAFAYCTSLKDIYYNGTKAQWNSIQKVDYWDYKTENYVVHCIDGDI